MSGIIHVMENVFDSLSDGLPISRDNWDTYISCDSLDRAWAVVTYNLDQKWAMLPPSVDVPLGVDDDDCNYAIQCRDTYQFPIETLKEDVFLKC